MRKRYIIFLLGIACMVSCEKNIADPVIEPAAAERTFYAEMSSPDETKTVLNGLNVMWAQGDQIKINGTTATLASGAGTTCATFGAAVSPVSGSWYALYPVSASTYTAPASEGARPTMSINIPAEQTYSENASGVMPMAAYAEGEGTSVCMSFANAANILKINLTKASTYAGELKVASIILVAEDGKTKINGDIPVTIDANKKVSFGDVTNGTSQTRLTFTNPVALNATPTPVYFIIPKVAQDKYFRLVISTPTDAIYSKKCLKTNDKTVTVNHVATASVTVTDGDYPYIDPWYEGEGIEINTVVFAPENKGTSADNKYGLLYQWGRKAGSGYPSGDKYNETSNIQTLITSYSSDLAFSALVDSLYYKPYEDILKKRHSEGKTIWSHDNGNDPCPKGWQIPDYEQMEKLTDTKKVTYSSSTVYETNDSRRFTCKGCDHTMDLLRAGCRYTDDSNGKCPGDKRGLECRYWTSYYHNGYNYFLWVQSSNYLSLGSSLAGNNAYSIRCVKPGYVTCPGK